MPVMVEMQRAERTEIRVGGSNHVCPEGERLKSYLIETVLYFVF